MSTRVIVGDRLENIDLLSILPPDEGEIDQYYGRIGSGKTYAATTDIVRLLKRGQVVYANWKIEWDGYDQRESRFLLFLGILGLKRNFARFPKENFHYFQVKDSFTDDLAKLNDCSVWLDEGHIPFDSYATTRMSIEKRAAVLHTRHYNRSIVIISQRPTAIHVTLRANVNRFFKLEKTMDFKFFGYHIIRFRKTEFQDTKENDTPDETRLKDKEGNEIGEYQFAVSSQGYFASKNIWKMYDTKYMRAGMETSQKNLAEFYGLRWSERLKLLFSK